MPRRLAAACPSRLCCCLEQSALPLQVQKIDFPSFHNPAGKKSLRALRLYLLIAGLFRMQRCGAQSVVHTYSRIRNLSEDIASRPTTLMGAAYAGLSLGSRLALIKDCLR
jgi:hypothetical protein